MIKIIIAGFGGQGVLSLGQFLAYSAMTAKKEVSWLPSYGPEMRGGTANCSVIISDSEIAAPVIAKPDLLVAMNKPSLIKFMDKVENNGVILVNSSLIDIKVERTDIKVYYIPANELAINCAAICDTSHSAALKAVNIIMLGVINKVFNILPHDKIYEGMKYGFSKKPQLIDPNIKMYHFGYDYIK